MEGDSVSLVYPDRYSEDGQRKPPNEIVGNVPSPPKPANNEAEGQQEGRTFTLPLDKEQRRRITITAPLDLNVKEINRIKQWIEVTLLIEGSTEEGKTM